MGKLMLQTLPRWMLQPRQRKRQTQSHLRFECVQPLDLPDLLLLPLRYQAQKSLKVMRIGAAPSVRRNHMAVPSADAGVKGYQRYNGHVIRKV